MICTRIYVIDGKLIRPFLEGRARITNLPTDWEYAGMMAERGGCWRILIRSNTFRPVPDAMLSPTVPAIVETTPE